MRVLMISHDANRCGAPLSFLALARQLAARPGVTVRLLTRRDGPLVEDMAKVAPLTVFRRPAPFSLKDTINLGLRHGPFIAVKCYRNAGRPYCLSIQDMKKVSDLREELRLWGVDIIYANTSHCMDVLDALNLQVPVVAHIREMAGVLRNLDHRCPSVARRLVKRFLAASDSVARDLERCWNIDPRRIFVEPPAIDLVPIIALDGAASAFPPAANIADDGSAWILGMGSVNRRKGADLFVQTATRVLAQAGNNIRFLWLGEGEWRTELRRKIAREGLEDQILFPGAVDNPHPYLHHAHGLLLTSREDPYPRVMIEAAAQGVPVVCFRDSGGAPEFVQRFACGTSVAHSDIRAMAEQATRLGRDHKKLPQAVVENVREFHRMEVSASRILKMLQQYI